MGGALMGLYICYFGFDICVVLVRNVKIASRFFFFKRNYITNTKSFLRRGVTWLAC